MAHASSGLKELWENLLANAMDPNRSQRVRVDLIAALKKLNPLDAAVMRFLKHGMIPDEARNKGEVSDALAKLMERGRTEILVSTGYLLELGLVTITLTIRTYLQRGSFCCRRSKDNVDLHSLSRRRSVIRTWRTRTKPSCERSYRRS